VTALVLTCEHASRRVPAALAPRFVGVRARRALAGHRGWDAGAVEVARSISRSRGAPLVAGRVTRLVVDLNRSEGNRNVFSEFVRDLAPAERKAVLDRWYRPFREAALAELVRGIGEEGRVVHLSAHSFTPRLRGRRRDYDVGLLYDPKRPSEREFAARWRDGLAGSGLVVRRNRPYRGDADGHTTALRRRFPASRYLGIELELNQALLEGGRFPAVLVRAVGATLDRVLESA
jgi:predicted N-formylglutamate amidohydrolase